MVIDPNSASSMARSKGIPAPNFISQQVMDARRFYLASQRTATDALSVVCGGWEDCASHYTIHRTTFPYFAVEFVAAGTGDITLAGTRHAIGPGTVFSYGPEVSQQIRTSHERRLRKYFVDFTGKRARAMLKHCRLLPGTVLQIANSAEIQLMFDTLIRIGSRHHVDVSHMAALQTELMLLSMRHSAAPATPDARRAFATFERCRQTIDTHFLELRNVQDAAERCRVNGSHFARLFRTFCGIAPLRYLHERQMEWAAQRLHSSNLLVREVADELDLDAFHFSRLFKRIHGLAPSAFISSRR